ncbi:MAG: PHP domain-containing protein [Acidobacteria bacterium]|nr:PHP domain-containing protein [Acidobacteriota bacterium]
MIDLHVHTTASDGCCSPSEVVRRAAAAGVTVLSIADHDTTAAWREAHAAATACGLSLVPGIEITAIAGDRDVHVLGYFFDPESPALTEFLVRQREDRMRRVAEMALRLATLGHPIDIQPIVDRAAANPHHSVARPHVARALVDAGHATSIADAFNRYIGEGCPAYVPRVGASPARVVRIIRASGGIASLAHPGSQDADALIPRLVEHGLDAIEAYHTEHDAGTRERYVQLADRLGLAVSGGSDFHGDSDHGAAIAGVTLPADRFAGLRERAAAVRQASASETSGRLSRQRSGSGYGGAVPQPTEVERGK